MSSANFLFIYLMLLGPMVSVSATTWVICWVGIELGFLGMIPLLFLSNSYMSTNKESGLKYFCIQALGSSFLFISGIMIFFNMDDYSMFKYVFIFSLCLKLGIFPGHFWVLSVISGLEWVSNFLLLSLQKIAPLVLMVHFLSSFPLYQDFVLMLGGVSALIGALIGNNQTTIRGMIGGSSISHSGWLLIACVSGYLWTYFIIYCISLLVIFVFLMKDDNFGCCISLLSLSGLPPFFMFIGKWCVIKSSLFGGISFGLLIFPILGTLISLFFYLKFSYSFYLDSFKIKNVFHSKKIIWGLSMFNFLGVFFLFLF